MCIGRGRSRGGGGGDGGAAARAAEDARRRANEDAARIQRENNARMAEMQAKLDAVKKASVYTNPVQTKATTGDISQGLDRSKAYAKRKRAMTSKKTRIALNPQGTANVGGLGGGQANP